jgi:hypothetical protein
MKKELDNFLLQVAQSLFRYNTHKDLQILHTDVDVLYDIVEHISDIENIYIGPLHTPNTYGYSVSSSFLAIADSVISNKSKIYENPLYTPDVISEGLRSMNNRESVGLLLCLGFLLGEKVFVHEGLIYRLGHLNKTELLQIIDYGEPVFGVKTLDITEYITPILRRVFELLNLAPNIEYSAYHRLYGAADIFIKVYEGAELPIKIPLDFAWYPSVKKAYLRYIMHHPEDSNYLGAFINIKAHMDRFAKQALHYFAYTVGGAYAPTKGEFSTPLSKWYEKEINEKQLDEIFDDIIKDERRTFEELVQLGIGISLEANLKLTKKRFARIQKLVESYHIAEYRELAGPFLIKDSSMLSIKILRRQIND